MTLDVSSYSAPLVLFMSSSILNVSQWIWPGWQRPGMAWNLIQRWVKHGETWTACSLDLWDTVSQYHWDSLGANCGCTSQQSEDMRRCLCVRTFPVCKILQGFTFHAATFSRALPALLVLFDQFSGKFCPVDSWTVGSVGSAAFLQVSLFFFANGSFLCSFHILWFPLLLCSENRMADCYLLVVVLALLPRLGLGFMNNTWNPCLNACTMWTYTVQVNGVNSCKSRICMSSSCSFDPARQTQPMEQARHQLIGTEQ